MLSKILAGVFAVMVLTAGGYAYWQYASNPNDSPAPTEGCSTRTTPVPCCQEPSRTCAIAPPCCSELDGDTSPEVLAIEPREVK